MKALWYWYVYFVTQDGRCGAIQPTRGFENEVSARFNIEARLNQSVPDLPGLPDKAVIVEWGVELENKHST